MESDTTVVLAKGCYRHDEISHNTLEDNYHLRVYSIVLEQKERCEAFATPWPHQHTVELSLRYLFSQNEMKGTRTQDASIT